MTTAVPPNFGMLQAGRRWHNADGTPTPAFFRLIGNLVAATGQGSILASIPNNTLLGNVSGNATVPVALTASDITPLVDLSVADSITGSGQAGDPLELVGDVETPGNSYFYGTNAAGAKGWYASSVGANPSAAVGLTAVEGIAATFMRSDAAPALSEAIGPTWTGNHIFSPVAGVAITINGVANTTALYVNSTATTTIAPIEFYQALVIKAFIGVDGSQQLIASSTNGDLCAVADNANISFSANSGATNHLNIASTGAVTASGPLGINGNAAPAQVTGFGTPTGASVVANFSGTAATTAQMQATIAQILTILKAFGMIAA